MKAYRNELDGNIDMLMTRGGLRKKRAKKMRRKRMRGKRGGEEGQIGKRTAR